MNSPNQMNLIFNNPEFIPSDEATTLVVMIHAYLSNPSSLTDLKTFISNINKRNEYDIYTPQLPYANWLDGTGANQIVVDLVHDLDEIWNSRKYDKVILIGHSLGGILLRRFFLAGSPNPPDYSDDSKKNLLFRDELSHVITGAHGWAENVERIILFASWDKGWSLSESIAWKYTLALNILGFWGRFFDLLSVVPEKINSPSLGRQGGLAKFRAKFCRPAGTILDMRLGTPFIVQTRLLWMAYRRWHSQSLRNLYNSKTDLLVELKAPPSGAANPLLIQIIGTQDDFVSPRDQVVDYDVEEVTHNNADPAGAQSKKYFLIEMPGANHKDVIKFDGDHKETCQKLFQCALTGDASMLEDQARNPAYFEDRPTTPDPNVKDVVFIMHGIRDDGFWTHRIAKVIKETAQTIGAGAAGTGGSGNHILQHGSLQSWTQTYGYFPMGAFLLPWIRQEKVEWFMDKYVSAKACYPNATFHYIGHSNGTYLAAKALEDYPAARFGRVYFAGSVVHPAYDWSTKIKDKRVERLHNARGATDWVVALLPKSIEYLTDLGGAGFDGFIASANSPSEITQSKCFAKGMHGGAIKEGHWPEIAQFIVTGKKPFESGEPCGKDKLFQEKQALWLNILSRFRIGIPFLFSLATMIIVWGFSRWLPSENQHWPELNLKEGWGLIWGSVLTAFLVLQLFLDKAPKPEETKGRLSLGLMATIMLSGTGLLLSSFFSSFKEFSKLDPTHFAIADITAAAYLSLVVCALVLRFILTRF
jgi:pimeloyl-ACP methyl ester carboxylesterase